jgi:hypothetical protein
MAPPAGSHCRGNCSRRNCAMSCRVVCFLWCWWLIVFFVVSRFTLSHSLSFAPSGAAVAPNRFGAPVRPTRSNRLDVTAPVVNRWKRLRSELFRIVGGRKSSCGRYATPADFPLLDCSPYRGLHAPRESLGFVHRSRTIFCRSAPNLDITIRNFCIAVRSNS